MLFTLTLEFWQFTFGISEMLKIVGNSSGEMIFEYTTSICWTYKKSEGISKFTFYLFIYQLICQKYVRTLAARIKGPTKATNST